MTLEEHMEFNRVRAANSASCDCKSCVFGVESAPNIIRCTISARLECSNLKVHQFYIPRKIEGVNGVEK